MYRQQQHPMARYGRRTYWRVGCLFLFICMGIAIGIGFFLNNPLLAEPTQSPADIMDDLSTIDAIFGDDTSVATSVPISSTVTPPPN